MQRYDKLRRGSKFLSARLRTGSWDSCVPAEANCSSDRRARIMFAVLSVAMERSFKAAAALNDVSTATDRAANEISACLSVEDFASAGECERQGSM